MSAITPAIRPAIGPAIRSAFDGGAPSLLAQSMALVRKYGGALYDLSNPDARFKEYTGQTPATTPGGPIGLLLDCQFGLVRGVEISPDPNIANPAAWFLSQPTSGSVTVTPGLVSVQSVDASFAAAHLVVGATVVGGWYELTVVVASTSGNGLRIDFTGYAGNLAPAPGVYRQIVCVTSPAPQLSVVRGGGANSGGTVTSVSIKQIPGNHLSQATTTARPLYQVIDGYPCIVGDGVDDFLQTAVQIPAGPGRSTTLGVAARMLSESADYRFLAGAGNSSPLRAAGIQRNTIAQNSYTGVGNYGTAVYTNPGGTHPNNITRVLALINQPDTPRSELFINGVAVATRVTTQGANATGPMTVSLFSGYAGGAISNSAIFAAAYLPAAATPAEQLVLTRFLASRSGVTL